MIAGTPVSASIFSTSGYSCQPCTCVETTTDWRAKLTGPPNPIPHPSRENPLLRHAENSWETRARQISALAEERGLSLRETVWAVAGPKPSPFVGSAQTVADAMATWFEQRALDGFNYTVNHPEQFRRFTGEVLPLLRERGLVRSEYESETLRGNLGLPVPENRHTAARREPVGAD